MFKRKSKKTAPPIDDEEVPNLEEDTNEEEKEVEEKETNLKSKKTNEPNPEDEELTEEKVKEVFANHEMRLQRIEYHLRI